MMTTKIDREFIFQTNLEYMQTLCPELADWQHVQLAEELTRRDIKCLELYNDQRRQDSIEPT